jgi:predicted PurR-regulated permease PerM
VTLQKQVLIWAISLGVLIFALWIFSPILLPFIAGLVLAYFLDPVADALQRLGLSRLASALFIVILAILTLVLALVILAPMLSDQLARFAGDLPGIIQSLTQRFDELAPQWMKDMLAKSGADVQGSVTQFAGKAADWILSVLKTLLSGGMALVNLVSLLVVTPIVTFYLLVDWDDMVATVDSWVPREHVETVRALGRDINTAMAGFIRGQGTVCMLLGIFYAVALSLAGLKFGLAIGLLAGALTFIPYAGALIGGVLAIGVALVQFWPEFWSIALVAGIFGAGQFLEGNFLSPKLVGKSVGLHPVWLMFALFAFGYAFGFVGLLLAVPLAAAAGVLVRFGLKQYLGSRLYLGFGEDADPVPVPVAIIAEEQQEASAERGRHPA